MKTELSKLESSVGYLIRDTHRLISRRLDKRLQSSGISIGQWYILRVLWNKDAITQREIATRIGMSEPNIVTALRDLEAQGIVARQIDDQDNRRRIVRVTRKGKTLKSRLMPAAVAVNADIMKGFSDADHAAFIDLLLRIRSNMTDEDSA